MSSFSLARRAAWLPVAAIALLAVTLRVGVASLSPVLDRVEAELSLPAVVVGFIGAAPPVAFAVFGIVTPALARHVSLERLAAISIAVAGAGILARAFATDAAGLLIATAVAFAAVGVANVILPALVKKYHPSRIGPVTTVYIAAMSGATIVPPLFAVPIADAAGWRFSLGIWAVVAVLALVPWIVLALRARAASADRDVDDADPAVLSRLLSLPRTWALIVGMVATSATAYTMFAWLPSIFADQAGVDAATGGFLLAVFAGMGLVFAFFAPVMLARFAAVRTLFLLATLPSLAGLAGLLFAGPVAPFAWAVLVSFPTLLFPVMLTIVGLRTRTHVTTVALSGAVQSLGYGIAAVFPIAVGALHEATGGWAASLILLATLCVAAIVAMFTAARPGTVEDDWESRHRATW